MATVITVSIQKGGVGKSTTAGTMAYLMSQEGYKVLALDLDSQGNLTDLLTGIEPEDFEGETILEAFEHGDLEPYIISVNENLHVVPADDFLATLAKMLYTNPRYVNQDKSAALKTILEPIKDRYDYVIIDTPPSLGEASTNAICASDYVVVLAESSKWAFTAIPRFLGTVEYAKEHINPNLKVAGILRTMNDARRADSKAFVELIGEEYPELVFDTVIKRKAATGRLSIGGIFDSSEREKKTAMEEYKLFYEELKNRMGVTVK